MPMSFCKNCGTGFHPRHGGCATCSQTPLNACQTLLRDSRDASQDFRDISSRPSLGVSLPERPVRATNIASDLPEGTERTISGVFPQTPTIAESVQIAQRIEAAIGRDDRCLECYKPLTTLLGAMSGRCIVCTTVRRMPDEIQTLCTVCGDPMVVSIDSFQVTCNYCMEKSNAN